MYMLAWVHFRMDERDYRSAPTVASVVNASSSVSLVMPLMLLPPPISGVQ